MKRVKFKASTRSFKLVFFVLCLQSKARSLEEALRLHRFYNSCQEFESWMEDKENVLNTFSTDGDNLGVVQAKYEVRTQHDKNLNRVLKESFNFVLGEMFRWISVSCWCVVYTAGVSG